MFQPYMQSKSVPFHSHSRTCHNTHRINSLAHRRHSSMILETSRHCSSPRYLLLGFEMASYAPFRNQTYSGTAIFTIANTSEDEDTSEDKGTGEDKVTSEDEDTGKDEDTSENEDISEDEDTSEDDIIRQGTYTGQYMLLAELVFLLQNKSTQSICGEKCRKYIYPGCRFRLHRRRIEKLVRLTYLVMDSSKNTCQACEQLHSRLSMLESAGRRKMHNIKEDL